MELLITLFFQQAGFINYSASMAEIGQNAGKDTWNQACEDSADYMLLDTEEKRQAYRKHVKAMGTWTDEEIAAWTDTELNALLLQDISAEARDAGIRTGEMMDWQEYERMSEAGQVSGRLFKGTDGEIYFYIGE